VSSLRHPPIWGGTPATSGLPSQSRGGRGSACASPLDQRAHRARMLGVEFHWLGKPAQGPIGASHQNSLPFYNIMSVRYCQLKVKQREQIVAALPV